MSALLSFHIPTTLEEVRGFLKVAKPDLQSEVGPKKALDDHLRYLRNPFERQQLGERRMLEEQLGG